MSSKLVLALFLFLHASAALGQQTQTHLREARQCRMQRISASRPTNMIQSEGGLTQLWNEMEDQFQCAGVGAFKNVLQPNSLSLPNFHPSPRLVYIERGQGLLGISYPGCPETYHSSQRSSREEGSRQGKRGSRGDLHQKVHRIRRGDIVALPAGAAHWCFNDGNEELVAVSVTDLNNQANQLDQKLRSFYLAGEPSRRGQESDPARQTFQNIIRAFDENLMAEAFDVPVETVRNMQKETNRGLIVKVEGGMRMIRPDEEGEQEGGGGMYNEQGTDNGLEETICNMRIHQNLDTRGQADVYSRQAGRLHLVNMQKLPILRYMDMSAEKGHLFPNALYSPHWSMNSHSIIYVTRGDAQVQVVGHNGQTIMDQRVSQGEMFVVPQYFASEAKAGTNGFEWVSIKTSNQPMKSPLVGYTSVFRAMPIDVITSSYQISPQDAQDLKLNRGQESVLLSPGRTST